MKIKCSYHQERLWFIDQFEAGKLYEAAPVYHNIPVILSIQGKPDLVKLQAGLNRIVDEHEVLRTVIMTTDEGPVQLIRDKYIVEIGEENADNEGDIWRGVKQPFIPGGPLIRATLFNLPKEEYQLCITVHHMIFDRYSCALLAEQLLHHYNGTENKETKHGLQYADFSQWQRSLPEDMVDYDLFYWKKKLGGELPVLELPAEKRENIHIFEEGVKYFNIDADISLKLLAYASRRQIDISVLLLAAFKLLFYKYSGQTDIITGVYTANREQPGLERAIGPFSNLLPVRATFNNHSSFSQLLTEVEKSFNEAHQHHHLPFDRLTAELELRKDMSRTVLFDVLFAYEHDPAVLPPMNGHDVRLVGTSSGLGKYDLNLLLQRNGAEISGILSFNSLYYNGRQIQRLISQYQSILQAVITDSFLSLQDLSLLTDTEREQFLDKSPILATETTIVKVFEEQARKFPNHIAITQEGKSFTYQELNDCSDALASYLQQHFPLREDSLVGIMMAPCNDTVIALLAVLKAGAGYLPIDPLYPAERRQYMIQDSRMACLLVNRECEERVPVVDIRTIQYGRQVKPESLINPGSMAYVIYTSGSTGQPKGCMITHRNVVSLIRNSQPLFGFRETDTWIMAHSFSFDFSVWEIFGALLNGGRLVIPSRDTVLDTRAFSAVVKQERVTVLNQTPMAFYNFASVQKENIQQDLSSHLRYVILGGDKVNYQQLFEWIDMYNLEQIQMINMYGITETTVHVSYYKIKEQDIREDQVSIVGKGLPGVNIYLFDETGNPVPVGVKGEIYVGGTGVSKGYLHNPALTAERFVTNEALPGQVLYRTGDIGKWREDGQLEYIERLDSQVKLRGYRIGLKEVEAALTSYEGIELAVAMLKGEGTGKYLVAYYKGSSEVQDIVLKRFLEHKIPSYMVPAHLVRMENFPLTINGKLDMENFPDPLSTATGESYQPAVSDLETRVTEIWQEVLGREKIGVKDDFFQLGGDSIKAIQISTRLYHLKYKMEIKDLFLHSTIESLIPVLEKIMDNGGVDQSVIEGEIPLTPVQHAFFNSGRKDLHHYNQSVMLFEQKGYQMEGVRKVMEKLQEHHDVLRTSYWYGVGTQLDSSEVIQMNNGLDYPLSLEEFDLKGVSEVGATLDTIAGKIQSSINLETGPLMKAGLFRMNDGDRLLIVIHHLVVDGISWRILLDDFAVLYRQYEKGLPLKLQLKTDAFRSWAEKLREYANTPAFLVEKGYWGALEAIPVPPLEKEFPVEENQVKDRAVEPFELTAEQTELLLTGVNKAYGTTVHDILVTGLGMAMEMLTGSRKLLVAMEGHGREEIISGIDINRTVGWFSTVYPVVLDMSYSNELSSQIREVKETLQRIPNKGIGHGMLKYLTDPGKLKGVQFNLAPQVSFNYLGEFDIALDNAELQTESEYHGARQSEDIERDYLLEIFGMVNAKKLSMSIVYNRLHFSQAKMQQLRDNYYNVINRIINHCMSTESIEVTQIDYTYKGLSLKELENIKNMFK